MMADLIEIAKDFNISMDMLDVLCGKYIGEGCTRIVFECNVKPGWVVKIERENDSHDNILERYMWDSVYAQPEIRKWLADCSILSNNGRILIQKKATPITDKNRHLIPDKIPSFLTDVKFDNCGFIGKQFVFFDYAFALGICGSNAMNNKMKKFKPRF